MADGIATTGHNDVSRIITDYKAQIESFPVKDFDWAQFVRKYESATGGSVEITFRNYSAGSIDEVAEGEEPKFVHSELTKISVSVKKFAEKPAITKEMIEDSRFDEIREALDHTTAKLRYTYVKEFMAELRAGPYGSTDIPSDFADRTWANAAAHLYAADHAGSDVNQSQAGHIYNTGAAKLYLGDINLAIRHISEHGFRADTMLISEKGVQQLADMAGFQTAKFDSELNRELLTLGDVRGHIAGLTVIVSPWVKVSEMIVTSRAAEPIAYVSRRAPTLEVGKTPDFDVEVKALSARFGFKTRFKGATVVATISA